MWLQASHDIFCIQLYPLLRVASCLGSNVARKLGLLRPAVNNAGRVPRAAGGPVINLGGEDHNPPKAPLAYLLPDFNPPTPKLRQLLFLRSSLAICVLVHCDSHRAWFLSSFTSLSLSRGLGLPPVH